MKKTKLAVLLLVILVAMPMLAAASPMDEIPQRVENGTVFVPLRLVANAHDAVVEWDAENSLVTLRTAQGMVMTFPVDGVGGFIEDGMSWVPYEFIYMFTEVAETEDAETDDATAELIAAIIQGIDETRLFVDEHSEILDITSTDGYVFQGRLTMPGSDNEVLGIVIDVGTSGPHTYLMRRYVPGIGYWNYWDFWAYEFVNRGVALFTANTRGVTHGTQPPFFVEVDEAGYLTYLPSNVVEDVFHMIRTLQEDPRLANAKIFLLGQSEGAVIAILFEETHPGMADVLLLTGVPITNMYDVVHWQASGRGSMMLLGELFDVDEYGRITEEAFYAGPWETAMGARFEALDLDGDGFFTASDLLLVWQLQGVSSHMYDPSALLDAIERGDDDWLRENYPVLLTSGWFNEHFSLRSNMELLPELDLPIYIFHGTLDLNVYVGYVRELYALLQELGRTNVTVNIFPGYNHDLNFDLTVFIGEMSDGVRAVLDAVNARIR